MAFFEGPVIDGPLAGQKLGQYGITHEIVVDRNGEVIDAPTDEMFKAEKSADLGVTIVRYQYIDGAWRIRSPKWDEAKDGWQAARTASTLTSTSTRKG